MIYLHNLQDGEPEKRDGARDLESEISETERRGITHCHLPSKIFQRCQPLISSVSTHHQYVMLKSALRKPKYIQAAIRSNLALESKTSSTGIDSVFCFSSLIKSLFDYASSEKANMAPNMSSSSTSFSCSLKRLPVASKPSFGISPLIISNFS